MNDGCLIDVPALATELDTADVCVVDCRHELSDPDAGRAAYLEAHVPGAVHADLLQDLSGPATTDVGRHPLPPPERLRAVFGALGIASDTQVVTYDDRHGMVAARLWWMLRYMGHERVRVLDGGWQQWVAEGFPVGHGRERRTPAPFRGEPRRERLVVLAEVPAIECLIDARAAGRYAGEAEPIDPRAGHIPGALNHGWELNLADDGRFLDGEALRRQLTDSLGILPGADAVHYCGSGVSACHNVLAQRVAGLPEPRLYCGSWSEWCRDPARPAATGVEMST